MRTSPTNFTAGLFLIVFVFGSIGCSFSVQERVNVDAASSTNSAPIPVATAEKTPGKMSNIVRNEVNGIAIGSTYDELIVKFGKPESIKTGGTNPCGGEKTVISYEGIVFHLDKVESDPAIVVLIEITSPNWTIAPGINTGLTIAEVRAKMGRQGQLKNGNGVERLTYGDGDGLLEFYFYEGKLVRIRRELNLC